MIGNRLICLTPLCCPGTTPVRIQRNPDLFIHRDHVHIEPDLFIPLVFSRYKAIDIGPFEVEIGASLFPELIPAVRNKPDLDTCAVGRIPVVNIRTVDDLAAGNCVAFSHICDLDLPGLCQLGFQLQFHPLDLHGISLCRPRA